MPRETPAKTPIAKRGRVLSSRNPDICSLSQLFNKKYFHGRLKHVLVRWSPRTFDDGRKVDSCGGIWVISLSLPLFKYRPRKDLVETVLHEMIHAYLFAKNKHDRAYHGPDFCKYIHRINKGAGIKISASHSILKEAIYYKKHWWRCNGPCRNQDPFYGYVMRETNHVPNKKDFWFAQHKGRCGGEFTEIKEPESYKLREVLPSGSKLPTPNNSTCSTHSENVPSTSDGSPNLVQSHVPPGPYAVVRCPVCSYSMHEAVVYEHLESCLFLDSVYENIPYVWTKIMLTCKGCTISLPRDLFLDHLKKCSDQNPCGVSKFFKRKSALEVINSWSSDGHIKGDTDSPQSQSKMVECPFCCQPFSQEEIRQHLDICFPSIFNK